MNLFFLQDANNFLRIEIIKYFSNDNRVFLLENGGEKFDKNVTILKNIENVVDFFDKENIFLFGLKFLNEYDIDDISYIDNIIFDLTQKYQFLQFISKNLIERSFKGAFYFFTFHSINLNTSKLPIKPIHDSAIEIFVKTVSKELTTFNIYSYCLRLESIFETMNFQEIRDFRKKMNIFAFRKTPTKILDILSFLNVLFHNNFKLLSGSIINVGDGMDF